MIHLSIVLHTAITVEAQGKAAKQTGWQNGVNGDRDLSVVNGHLYTLIAITSPLPARY